MSDRDYFLPAGYKCNSVRAADDSDGIAGYWTAKRIQESHAYQYQVYSLALMLLPQSGAATLIDVGCGPGTKLSRIAKLKPRTRIIGFDRASAIDYCRSNHTYGEWHLLNLDAPDLTEAKRGNVIVCADVIEHLAHPYVLLDFLRGAALPGARIVISTPDREALHGPDCLRCPNSEHVREWSAREFTAMLRGRGFRIVHSEMQMPMRLRLNQLSIDYVVGRLLRLRPLRATQVHVIEAR